MKNNFNNQQSNNKNDMNKVDSDSRMRAQNRDIINEGKNLAKNSQSRNQSSNNSNQSSSNSNNNNQ